MPEVPGPVPTQVDIYGMSYTIRGEGTPEEIRRAAGHVDETMREIAQATGLSDTLKVAVLAALHIADDYLRVRGEMSELETSVAGAASDCRELLDSFLGAQQS